MTHPIARFLPLLALALGGCHYPAALTPLDPVAAALPPPVMTYTLGLDQRGAITIVMPDGETLRGTHIITSGDPRFSLPGTASLFPEAGDAVGPARFRTAVATASDARQAATCVVRINRHDDGHGICWFAPGGGIWRVAF